MKNDQNIRISEIVFKDSSDSNNNEMQWLLELLFGSNDFQLDAVYALDSEVSDESE